MSDLPLAQDWTAENLALLDLMERKELLVSVKELATGRYVYANARYAELMGRSTEQLLSCSDADVLDAPLAAALRAADQTAAAQRSAQWSEHRIERGGQRREFSVHRMVWPAPNGGMPLWLVSAWNELTETRQHRADLQQALQQLEQQQQAAMVLRQDAQDASYRDAATGLYQRSQFDEQLRREFDLSSREHREFALVSILVDPLPEPLKDLGSQAHDRVLEALARLLRSNTRAMDASCRLDADRFAVLLSGVGLATAHSRMEGLRRQCATQIVVLDGRHIGFTVSMGVASFPHTAHDEAQLLQAAETALKEACRRGGNHVTLATIRLDERS